MFSKLLFEKKLFYEYHFQFFEAVILIEIRNLIIGEDSEEIGDIKMTSPNSLNSNLSEIL